MSFEKFEVSCTILNLTRRKYINSNHEDELDGGQGNQYIKLPLRAGLGLEADPDVMPRGQ